MRKISIGAAFRKEKDEGARGRMQLPKGLRLTTNGFKGYHHDDRLISLVAFAHLPTRQVTPSISSLTDYKTNLRI